MTQPAFDFSAFVPGFDFLQKLSGLGKQPAAPLPAMGQWVAPTLSVEDIDKRIQELKAVQFWLDQNATALKATVQALEVQKMTLATLNGMNVSLQDLAQAFQIKPPQATAPAPSTAPTEAQSHYADSFKPTPAPTSAPEPTPTAAKPLAAEPAAPPSAPTDEAPAAHATPAIDPLNWWGALTAQFQHIANQAMSEVAKHAATPITPAAKKTTRRKAPAQTTTKTAAKAKPAAKKTARAAKTPHKRVASSPRRSS